MKVISIAWRLEDDSKAKELFDKLENEDDRFQFLKNIEILDTEAYDYYFKLSDSVPF